MVRLDQSAVEEALAQAGGEDGALRPTASAKFMFGETCFAIACGKPTDAARFLVRLPRCLDEVGFEQDGTEVATRMADAQRVDQLGLGWIVYFPGFGVDETEERSAR